MAYIPLIDRMNDYNSNQPGGPQVDLSLICEEPNDISIFFHDESDLGSAIDTIYEENCRILRMSNWSDNSHYLPIEPEEIEKHGFDPREDQYQPHVYFKFVCSVLIQWKQDN